jgi:DNA-binding NarL/FixJ family response regulator
LGLVLCRPGDPDAGLNGGLHMSEAQVIRCANCGALNRAPAGKLAQGLRPVSGRYEQPLSADLRESDSVFNNSSAKQDRSAAPLTIIPPQKRTDPELIVDSLTQREIEVLKHIAEGYSTKELAAILGITFKTAACHRTHIMEKLGIHNTARLVRYALEEGIVEGRRA